MSGRSAGASRKVSDRTKLPYEFVVLNNSVPNAWALPGGKIGINRGLLLELENEAELAAVLSHEVVHSAARHGGQALTRNLLFGVAQIAIALTGRKSRNINYILGGTGLAFQLVNRATAARPSARPTYYGMKYHAQRRATTRGPPFRSSRNSWRSRRAGGKAGSPPCSRPIRRPRSG